FLRILVLVIFSEVERSPLTYPQLFVIFTIYINSQKFARYFSRILVLVIFSIVKNLPDTF
ncbi:MAG: hypothetical protein MGG37_01080, partial [Trichodesmium sp. MAG_R01]|nr:hypothetical protein [Trichodesmium sp. MAG_R01]